jgi:hypothetical protein
VQQLLGPTNGTCIDDQFIVTGQNTNSIAPIICGINTGQHSESQIDVHITIFNKDFSQQAINSNFA